MFCLHALCEIAQYSVEDLIITRSKFIYKQEHELSSDDLVRNRIIHSLIKQSDIPSLLKKEKIRYSLDSKLIKDIFLSFKKTEEYRKYTNKEE